MTKTFYKLGLFLIFIPAFLFWQTPPPAQAKYTNTPPVIDGNLDDEAWKKAKLLSDFRQNFPTDTLPAQHPTDIKFLFDDTYLYIAIRAQSSGDNFVARSLKRDFRG